METDKQLIISPREVSGNLSRYGQRYSYEYLPEKNGLPQKVCLNVKTDIFNSIRFQNPILLFEFVSDSLVAWMVFNEITKRHILANGNITRHEFRTIELDDALRKLRMRCVNELLRGR